MRQLPFRTERITNFKPHQCYNYRPTETINDAIHIAKEKKITIIVFFALFY